MTCTTTSHKTTTFSAIHLLLDIQLTTGLPKNNSTQTEPLRKSFPCYALYEITMGIKVTNNLLPTDDSLDSIGAKQNVIPRFGTSVRGQGSNTQQVSLAHRASVSMLTEIK